MSDTLPQGNGAPYVVTRLVYTVVFGYVLQ